jgi:hypothetical protein
MSHVRHAVLAFGFLFAFGASARADDAADAKAIVEKAVKAHGGQDKLDKFPGTTVAMKGKVHVMEMAIPFTGEVTTLGADKLKLDIEIEAGGMKFRVVNVVAGDKGWAKMGDATTELDKDQLAEAKEQAYVGWVESLTPLLKDKQFSFATVGEVKVNDKPALGVKVSSKGHRDVDLYFDKETGVLVKREARVKDEGSGQEVTEESFPSEYKDVQGIKHAMKFTIKRDGKLFLEGEATEYTLSEKLPADFFGKP